METTIRLGVIGVIKLGFRFRVWGFQTLAPLELYEKLC